LHENRSNKAFFMTLRRMFSSYFNHLETNSPDELRKLLNALNKRMKVRSYSHDKYYL
jgi:hypothetical protein